MISVDTNILLYAQNKDYSEHRAAYDFISEIGQQDRVVICELVLVELYVLLRNPAVIKKPLTSSQAAETCDHYRQNPKWRLVENAPVMDAVWQKANTPQFPRRKIFDTRIALTLIYHGVTELATANTKDFQDFGLQRVWNPLLP